MRRRAVHQSGRGRTSGPAGARWVAPAFTSVAHPGQGRVVNGRPMIAVSVIAARSEERVTTVGRPSQRSSSGQRHLGAELGVWQGTADPSRVEAVPTYLCEAKMTEM